MDESGSGDVSVPPKLDILSDEFDAKLFFSCPYDEMKGFLPYPEVKPYNNLAEYYSHNFLKKDTLKRKEKERYYDRPFSWYYACMGWDRETIRRYEYRQQRRCNKYQGWRTAKMRKYIENDPDREPCRGFPPLKSTKIIQLDTPFRRRKIIPLNVEENLNRNSTIDEQDRINDVSNKTEIDLEPDHSSFVELMNKTRTSKRNNSKSDDSMIEKSDVISDASNNIEAKRAGPESNSLTEHMNKTGTPKRKNDDFNRKSTIRTVSEVMNNVSNKAETEHIELKSNNLTEHINGTRISKRKNDNFKRESTIGRREVTNDVSDKAETGYGECDSNSFVNKKSATKRNYYRISTTKKSEVLNKGKQIEYNSNSFMKTSSKTSKLNLKTFPSNLKPNCFQKRFLKTVQ